MDNLKRPVSPQEFFSHLFWLDGRPLPEVIEPYRARIFEQALYTFTPEGWPQYSLAFCGRAKKNWKSADLILAGLYRFMVWPSSASNDVIVLGNDLDQSADDLQILTKIILANPLLQAELDVRVKEVIRLDGKGTFKILPAKDIAGAHGKQYLFAGFDEIHGYKNFDLFEALAMDPTRRDCLQWITSYDTIFSSKKVPLAVLKAAGKSGKDPRMYFSWYSADFCTDPEAAKLPTPEERANPSLPTWNNPLYLPTEKTRLPTHQYRRLHLNLPGAAEGVFFDSDKFLACVIPGRKFLPREKDIRYSAFVDMSGGSLDEAILGISYLSKEGKLVLARLESQAGKPPFDPRKAVKKFCGILREYGLNVVTGDAYAGQTFRKDFEAEGVRYLVSKNATSDLYQLLEPKINSGIVEILDNEDLIGQGLTLIWKGAKVSHQNGDHDDFMTGFAGSILLAAGGGPKKLHSPFAGGWQSSRNDVYGSNPSRYSNGPLTDQDSARYGNDGGSPGPGDFSYK
jgi:hypothetical protein